MTIQSLLAEGSGLALGPVRITKDYGTSPAGKFTKRKFLCEDASGKGIVAIMGPAANGTYGEGNLITITGQGQRGGLKVDEYPQGSGKMTITGWDCKVDVASEASAGNAGALARSQAPVQAHGKPALGVDELVARQVDLIDRMYCSLKEKGLPEEVCIQAASRAPQATAMWFHGEKWAGQAAGE